MDNITINLDTYKPNYQTEATYTHGARPDLYLLKNIPFGNFHQTFAMSGCWGIARLFYALYGVQFHIDGFYYIDDKEHLRREWDKCFNYLQENFDAVPLTHTKASNFHKVLKYGDAVCWQKHIGIYIGKHLGRPSLLCQPFGSTNGTTSRIIALDKEYYCFDVAPNKRYETLGGVRVFRPARFCQPYKLTESDKAIIEMNHSKNPYYVNLASVPLDGDSLLEFGDAYSRYLMYRGHGEEAARKLSSDAITMKLHLIFKETMLEMAVYNPELRQSFSSPSPYREIG